ncbi:fructosamine kinase family protein [Marinobacter sp. CHS3-4]|uniref:fructosamine kinase family protein n=1 Tax=Marinobacter sp. CHS3-4 TaxID=3045174 RepID=UPI0024B5048D|nr:fructosamine kinase family protein [Marinobacter sp. CHS3-4]MDI9246317.1 fructosamine kinase family protein [Marinobacter sp. CHS3-4]
MEFIKRNATSFRDALIREAEGLQLLAATLRDAGETGPGCLKVPEVIRSTESELVIPQVVSAPATDRHMKALGEGLARMHLQTKPDYGLDHDNMIGLSRQYNTRMDDWGRFYLDYRLRPQLEMIRDAHVREEFETTLQKHAAALRDFLNEHCEHPSVLHGDLWGGNALFDDEGPWLIDPAVYFGDREADIAMTELFGGFSPTFYRAYDSVYPRTRRYSLKRPIYNLYHTLNHYNLFGSSYLGSCRRNIQALERL